MTYFGKISPPISSSFLWDGSKISGSVGPSSAQKNFTTIGFYTTTTNTGSNPTTAGQVELVKDVVGKTINTVILRSVLSTTSASSSASIKLYNHSAGNFVDIGGPGITVLSTTNTTPTIVESVDLMSASNFYLTGAALYELTVFSQTGSQTATLGSSMFVHSQVTGSTDWLSMIQEVFGSYMFLRSDMGVSASGGKVWKWVDQSGNRMDVTQSNTSYQPDYITLDPLLGRRPALYFSGTQALHHDTIQSFPVGAKTIFMVYNTTTTPKPAGTGLSVNYLFKTTGSGEWYEYTLGDYSLYKNHSYMFGTAGPSATIGVNEILQTGSYTLNSVRWDGVAAAATSSYNIRMNKIPKFRETAATFAPAATWLGSIGGGVNSSGVPQAPYGLTGSIALCLVYTSSLTTNQTRIIEQAINSHFNLGYSFDPLAEYNPAYYFRSDRGLVTNAGLVASWSNQAANGYVLSQSDTTRRPTFVAAGTNAPNNGLGSVDFQSGALLPGEWLSMQKSAAISQPFNVFAGYKLSRTTPAPGAGYKYMVMYDTEPNVGFEIQRTFQETTGYSYIYANSVLATTSCIDNLLTASYVVETDMYNGASSAIIVNGVQQVTGDPGSAVIRTLQLNSYAGFPGAAEAYPFSGSLSIFMVVPGYITADRRREIEQTIANTCGFVTSSVPPWNWGNLALGPTVHMRPEDLTGSIGSSIDSWTNPGTAAGSFDATGLERPQVTSINGVNVADFNGTDWKFVANGINLAESLSETAYHCFCVVNINAIDTNGTEDNNDAIVTDDGMYWGLTLRTTSSVNYVQSWFWNGGVEMCEGSGLVLSASTLLETWYDGTNLKLRIGDGAVTSMVPTIAPNFTSGSQFLLHGSNNANNGKINGKIGELALFNYALSGSDQTNVRQYYATKYGVVA